MLSSEQVAYIEADQVFKIAASRPSTTRVARTVQSNAPWGLGRISHRKKGSTDYVYDPAAGVYIYVLDTGVRVTHQLFGGRASFGFNAVGDGSNTDTNGHGTHVAGTASSQTYGVARYASVIAVKVLGGDGSGTSMLTIFFFFQCWSISPLLYTLTGSV